MPTMICPDRGKLAWACVDCHHATPHEYLSTCEQQTGDCPSCISVEEDHQQEKLREAGLVICRESQEGRCTAEMRVKGGSPDCPHVKPHAEFGSCLIYCRVVGKYPKCVEIDQKPRAEMKPHRTTRKLRVR